MTAVILAGGLGTRLQPFTFSIPKPLLPLGERTIIEVCIERLRNSGIHDVILCTGYMSDLVRSFCKDGAQWGVRIDYCVEQQPLGTAGPLSLLKAKLRGVSSFLLLNGDVVTDLEFGALARFHEDAGNAFTVAYVELTSQSPFGVLEIEHGLVKAIHEKPKTTQSISAGVYEVDTECLELIPEDAYFTVPQLIERLQQAGLRVGAYRIEGYWKGLETTDHIEDVLRYLEGRRSTSGAGEPR